MNAQEEQRLAKISQDSITFYQEHENSGSPELIEHKMQGYVECVHSLFGDDSNEYKLCLNLFKHIV